MGPTSGRHQRGDVAPHVVGLPQTGSQEHDKSAPAGAGTPIRGLADREEHDRLMATLPRPADASPPCTEPHVDGCPACTFNIEPPLNVDRKDGTCLATYRCSDCGHRWPTAWRCG